MRSSAILWADLPVAASTFSAILCMVKGPAPSPKPWRTTSSVVARRASGVDGETVMPGCIDDRAPSRITHLGTRLPLRYVRDPSRR